MKYYESTALLTYLPINYYIQLPRLPAEIYVVYKAYLFNSFIYKTHL